MVAPAWTTGPSRPELAPKPKDTTETMKDIAPLRRDSSQFRTRLLSITSATLAARPDWLNTARIIPTISPPKIGTTKTTYHSNCAAPLSMLASVAP